MALDFQKLGLKPMDAGTSQAPNQATMPVPNFQSQGQPQTQAPSQFASMGLKPMQGQSDVVKNGPIQITPQPDTSPNGFLDSRPWLKDLMSGVQKGFVQTGTAGAKLLQPVAEFGARLSGASEQQIQQQRQAQATVGQAAQESKSGWETAGMIGEQALELAAMPEAGLEKGAVTKAIPKLAETTGGKVLAKTIETTPKAGIESAIMGAQSLVHGATPQEAKSSAAIAFAFPYVSEVAKAGLSKAVEKMAPTITGLGKGALDWVKENADKVLPKWQLLTKAAEEGTQPDAESVIRGGLRQKATELVGKAKQVASDKFSAGLEAIKKKFPDVKGDAKSLQKTFDKSIQLMKGTVEDAPKTVKGGLKYLSEVAIPAVSNEDRQMIGEFRDLLLKHDNWSIDGLRDLKNTTFDHIMATDEGTPAHKIFSGFYNEIDNELNRITKQEMRPLNEEYAKFKDAMQQVKPIWSAKAKEDSARNFISNLESKAKTGARDAVQNLENLAGTPGHVTDEVTAVSHARKLALKSIPPGSRVRDTLMSELVKFIPEAAGAAAGYFGGGGAAGAVGGAALGRTVGTSLALHALSPQKIAESLFSEAKSQGVILTSKNKKFIMETIIPRVLNMMSRESTTDRTSQASSQDIQQELQSLGWDTSTQESTPMTEEQQLKLLSGQ